MPNTLEARALKISRCITAAAQHNVNVQAYFQDRSVNSDTIAVLTVRTIEKYHGDPEAIAAALHHYAATLTIIAGAQLDALYGKQNTV